MLINRERWEVLTTAVDAVSGGAVRLTYHGTRRRDRKCNERAKWGVNWSSMGETSAGVANIMAWKLRTVAGLAEHLDTGTEYHFVFDNESEVIDSQSKFSEEAQVVEAYILADDYDAVSGWLEEGEVKEVK